MTERERLIEDLFSNILFLENRIRFKEQNVLTDYDYEILLDITYNIYEAIRILKTTEESIIHDGT